MKPVAEKTSNAKQGKKKTFKKQAGSMFQTLGDMSGSPASTTKKVAKTRVVSKKETTQQHPLFLQKQEKPSSDTLLPDEYRVLRHKYLLLEEETFNLGRELRKEEEMVKTLEDEKLSLLDELVVLEGLLDPSELHPKV
ncbi:uncharacterized protein LOC124915259 [Impatiens glandulifera]|uniref:uncharacterized protein LOC124915259 n=1 Tax=Impatiens glandulifera TaxID=253017 RepID=UPI001FB0AC07|nr:uncharacterized protein LOC124915259 [Impatiens glandulifera]